MEGLASHIFVTQGSRNSTCRDEVDVHLQELMYAAMYLSELTEIWQHIAQVQSRLGRHLEAWSTLKQARDWLQGPALAQALASSPRQDYAM